jgi:hypothetical protein
MERAEGGSASKGLEKAQIGRHRKMGKQTAQRRQVLNLQRLLCGFTAFTLLQADGCPPQ